MPKTAVVEFPFAVEIGPYRFRVELVPKSQLARKNENSETDYNQEVIRIASHLGEKEVLAAFLKRVVFVLHYTHGLDDTSTEECYTHSFATGLLEFASRNPAAWYWLNSMFSHVSTSNPEYERYATGHRIYRKAPPRRVLLNGSTVTMDALDASVADRDNVWGYYSYAVKGVRLHEQLMGRHLSVIWLHELTHAFHHAAKMKKRETRRRFVRAQVAAWLDFVKANPNAWAWFLTSIRTRKAKAVHLKQVSR